MTDDKPPIPENIEELIKALDGHLFALDILMARVIQHIERHDGPTAARLFQESEQIFQEGATSPLCQDDWRSSSFGIGFSNALVRIRGILDDLPTLD